VADGRVLDASFERPPCRVEIAARSTAQRDRALRAGRCHTAKKASNIVIDVDQDIMCGPAGVCGQVWAHARPRNYGVVSGDAVENRTSVFD
jgi:hypothetical protein